MQLGRLQLHRRLVNLNDTDRRTPNLESRVKAFCTRCGIASELFSSGEALTKFLPLTHPCRIPVPPTTAAVRDRGLTCSLTAGLHLGSSLSVQPDGDLGNHCSGVRCRFLTQGPFILTRRYLMAKQLSSSAKDTIDIPVLAAS
jgi:hypothetical protein